MNSNIMSFNSEMFGSPRIITDENGEPLFVARDIATALGYNSDSKVGMLFKHIPAEWKGVKQIYPSRENGMTQAREARRAVEAKLAVAEPKAQLVDATFANHNEQPLRLSEVVRKLAGVNTQAIKRDLAAHGYLYKNTFSYRVYAQYRDNHFVEKFNPFNGQHDIYATSKGAAMIARLYYDGQLTMKKAFQRGVV